MKFLEALDLVSAGSIVRRKNWASPAGYNIGVNSWYVAIDDQTDMVSVFDGDNCSRGELRLTKDNLASDDWELVKDTYKIELAALKRKHGRH